MLQKKRGVPEDNSPLTYDLMGLILTSAIDIPYF